jgi:tetratricopeptide (TPR) repeat protein
MPGETACSMMRFFRRICVACFFVVFASHTTARAATNETVIARAETKFQDAHHRLQTETNSTEAGWQFARACFDLAELATNDTRRAAFANQAIAACRQVLARDTNSAPAHYYLGMAIGQLADSKHNLSSLGMVKDMEHEFLTAFTLDKLFDFAGPDRNLGLLYAQSPAIISVGSRSKARLHLERAVKLAPDFPENRLNLIEAYSKWGDSAAALRELKALEKLWPDAQKKFTSDDWAASWPDWEKRINNVKKKLEDTPKTAVSPKAAD